MYKHDKTHPPVKKQILPVSQRPHCGILTAHNTQILFTSVRSDELKLFTPMLPEVKEEKKEQFFNVKI